MIIFLLLILLVMGALCGFMAWRTLALCPFLQHHPHWVWGFFAGFLILQFGVMALHRIPALTHRLGALHWFTFGLLGLISTYFVYLIAADGLQLLARGLFHAPPAIALWAFLLAVTCSCLSVLYGLVTALRPVALHRVEVPITGLPPALDGFRIIQISDLHLGPMARRSQLEHLTALANAHAPDLVAITGDLVDSEADGTRDKATLLRGLQARHGVYFVTGNHEYYSGVGPWLTLIREMGWKALLNAHDVFQHEGTPVILAGLVDPAAAMSHPGQQRGPGPDLDKALAGAPSEGTRILLFHQPLLYAQAEGAGVSLQLSGHTHGGQYFPWSLLVQRIFAYPLGLHQHGRMWIYTSPGTGFWGPPNRFRVPPELTLLVLKRA